MKSAKLPVAETSSHRRSQPVRQARTNPSRSTGPLSRTAGDRDLDAPASDQPIEIFPATTHFADTISALPKELVRHFTLLKEVDAKIFGPEAELFNLVAAAAETPSSALQPNVDRINGALPGSTVTANRTAESHHNPPVNEYSDVPRPHLLRQATIKLHELLGSLEEKNHVLSTANEALHKQTARIDDVWPYLEEEFTDEAKWGSSTHWAYPENRNGKQSQAERTRRDGAAAISAAAQALADEAAARSDARKQAVQAKKSQKANQLESEADDQDGKAGKGEGAKKGKSRKTTEAGVGLGISSTPSNGTAQPKKRKTEKAPNGGTAMASVLSSQGQSKAKTSSPRATPAPDGPKKRKALPSGSGQAKKTKTSGTMSPSVGTSPVVPPLPEPKALPAASPAPATTPRQPSARSRQNSLQSSVMDNGKPKVPNASTAKPNGRTPIPNHATTPKDPPQPTADPKAPEKPPAAIKTEKKETERPEPTAPAVPGSTKKDVKAEEAGRKNEPTPPGPVMPTVTTKSGRASKPSTPALATFQEAARSRPSRGEGASSKKGHKRSNSTLQAPPPRVVEEDTTSSAPGEDDDVDVDADEPRYCYCEGVSYGEMVACDSDDCAREWFHLGCVGLKVAPGSKTKWYCEDCKERLKRQKPSGR